MRKQQEDGTIRTERLEIRLLQQKDWKDIQEICKDFEASEFAAFDYPLPTEAQAVQTLTEGWVASRRFYGVRLIGAEELMGYVCFYGDEAYDIGFAFKRRFQGAGYAYEASWALMKLLSGEKGTTKFTAGLALGNTPSYHLVQKLGFSLADTEVRAFRQDKTGQKMMCQCGIFERTM